jgi:hypothetical protein
MYTVDITCRMSCFASLFSLAEFILDSGAHGFSGKKAEPGSNFEDVSRFQTEACNYFVFSSILQCV